MDKKRAIIRVPFEDIIKYLRLRDDVKLLDIKIKWEHDAIDLKVEAHKFITYPSTPIAIVPIEDFQ